MTTIRSVDAVPVSGGFFCDDQRAIKGSARQEHFDYDGEPLTPGFERIREPAEGISVMMTLSTGQVAVGDCVSVQYSAVGGRDSVFRAAEHLNVIEDCLADVFVGRNAEAFEANTAILTERRDDLHTAVRYGVSQALLDAAAKSRKETMTEVLSETYDTEPATQPVPVYAQSGDNRRANSEKMILKDVDVLPHGLFNNVEKIGQDGERLVEFLQWLASRVDHIGKSNYEPTFHVDVYGNIGELFEPPYDRPAVVEYFATLEQAAEPYDLQIESPVDAGSRESQVMAMATLRDGLSDSGINVDIVADEWCDTLDDVRTFVDQGAADVVQVKAPDLGGIHRSVQAIRYTDKTDVGAYLGGSCVETDVSARVSAHVALATSPVQVLAKPGMGVDEGIVIVRNEMMRTLNRLRR